MEENMPNPDSIGIELLQDVKIWARIPFLPKSCCCHPSQRNPYTSTIQGWPDEHIHASHMLTNYFKRFCSRWSANILKLLKLAGTIIITIIITFPPRSHCATLMEFCVAPPAMCSTWPAQMFLFLNSFKWSLITPTLQKKRWIKEEMLS